jgi:hypothetical protein
VTCPNDHERPRRQEFASGGSLADHASERSIGGLCHVRADGTASPLPVRPVSFRGAVFSGGEVDFVDAKFSGDTVGFDRAEFSGGDVNFGDADDWSHPPSFDWEMPPPGVLLPVTADGENP